MSDSLVMVGWNIRTVLTSNVKSAQKGGQPPGRELGNVCLGLRAHQKKPRWPLRGREKSEGAPSRAGSVDRELQVIRK